MATGVPVVGQTYTFYVPVVSQGDTDIFQAAATIAAGDFQISINGGAFNNLDNLPAVTPAGGKSIKIIVSATETTDAGNFGKIVIIGSDAAGDEWQDVFAELVVFPSDLALTGADGDTLKDISDELAAAETAIRGADNDDLKDISDEIAASCGLGAGAIEFIYTLTSTADGSPIPDADVWVTSDAGGATVVASGQTNTLGQVTFWLDAGTYYVWRQKSGWNFTNPDTEVVA